MAKKKPNKKKATSQAGSSLVPPKKTLRSQPPDVIVTVGQGKKKIEFECYKYALCYNCEYFDSMLSLPMRENETSRIDLPDKDPEEWKTFYEFIDPATSFSAEVTNENAMILAPWFHEYQMEELLAKCDSIMESSEFLFTYIGNESPGVDPVDYLGDEGWFVIVSDDIDVVDDMEERVIVAEKLLDYFSFCEQYSLEQSLDMTMDYLKEFMANAFHVLKENLNILKKVFEIYKIHKEDINEYLSIDGIFTPMNPYEDLEKFESEGEGIDWDNRYFRCMLESKLELMNFRRYHES